MSLVTLTTDFGLQDWFVGTMKGVILARDPRARLVDISHGIAAGDIRGGALSLVASYRFFPKNTVHVVVIDPGVGSTRYAIAVQTDRFLFVGPDNGVLSFALAQERVRKVHLLENERYFLHPVSRTFHGRDIFAPVAAHLSAGLPMEKLGPRVADFVRLPWPQPSVRNRRVEGEVVYLDRFGNAITNVNAAALKGLSNPQLFLKGKRLCGVADFYQAVAQGKPVVVLGSSGFLELAINGGSAAERYGIKVGAHITVSSRQN